MRIRQIKPAFWSDARIAELSEGARLFYVGLWMIADDAGWFRWDPVEVSRDLYGYEGRARREKRAGLMFDQLVQAGRVILHDCGHAAIPTMSAHQHLAGLTRQVRTSENEHLRGCITSPRSVPPSPASPRDNPPRLGTERSGDGQGRNGQVSQGNAPAGATLLTQRDEEDAAELAGIQGSVA